MQKQDRAGAPKSVAGKNCPVTNTLAE